MLVSVVIPAYNDSAFIAQAIGSVLAQSYRPLEIIVVDDGSTDDTVAVARACGEGVRVIEQPNSGSAVARTRGMQEARGQLIAFLDADDYWLPGKLAAQVAHLKRHPHVGAVYCDWCEWPWPRVPDPLDVVPDALESPDTPPGVDPAGSGWIYARLLLDCIVHTSTVVLRREIVERVGPFDSRLRKGQDYDYWLRCSRVTEFHKLDRILSLYRIRSDSITRRITPTNYAALVVEGALANWGSAGPDGTRPPALALARRRAYLWRDFAANHLVGGDKRVAVTAALRALARWPFDPIPAVILARVVRRALAGA